MTETLEALLELQKVDEGIRENEKARDELPRQIAELDEQIEQLEKQLNSEREQLENLQKDKRRIERELSISESARVNFEEQLVEVTTAREYTALQHEIDAERRKSANMEEEILSVMDKIEAKIKTIETLEKTVTENVASFKTKKQVIQVQYDSIDSTLKQKYEDRKKVMLNVKPDILSQYNRIWRSRTPVVAPVKKGACSGCYRALPPQMINMARMRDRLLTCEGCGRLVYWPEESSRFV